MCDTDVETDLWTQSRQDNDFLQRLLRQILPCYVIKLHSYPAGNKHNHTNDQPQWKTFAFSQKISQYYLDIRHMILQKSF